MATIRVIFRASSPIATTGTLFFRIIHKRKVRMISTHHRIMRTEWDTEAAGIIYAGEPERVEYLKDVQRDLNDVMARFRLITCDLDCAGADYSVDAVIEQCRQRSLAGDFVAFVRQHISELRLAGRVQAARHYATALNSFIRFNGEAGVPFEAVDANLMTRYECYLKQKGLCPNSTSYYMRNLRAVYNHAVELKLSSQRHPFKNVYTGVAKTAKRALSLESIRALRNLELRHDPLTLLARDLFLFSFYTRGMAIIDMAYLRRGNLKNGSLTYLRRKTGQYLTMKWEPQMQAILSRHTAADSDFLFPMIDSHKPDFRKQYLNSYCKLVRRLKKIGKMLGLNEPLTFHRSRHSWASIARDNNVPLSVICEGMGHDSEKTTRIYLSSLATSVVDKANRSLISLLEK